MFQEDMQIVKEMIDEAIEKALKSLPKFEVSEDMVVDVLNKIKPPKKAGGSKDA